MSYSSLATKYIPAHSNNHWGKRTEPIRKIVLHHMAGKLTGEACAKTFQNPSRGASASYCIGYKGDIVCGLDEAYVPGTSGGYNVDKDSVTIETSNSKSGGDWPISDEHLVIFL